MVENYHNYKVGGVFVLFIFIFFFMFSVQSSVFIILPISEIANTLKNVCEITFWSDV